MFAEIVTEDTEEKNRGHREEKNSKFFSVTSVAFVSSVAIY